MPDPFRTETFTYGHSAALRLSCAASAGVLLDRLLGEVWRWHLRVGFDRLAGAVKTRPNRGPLRGVSRLLAWALVVLPWVALTFWAKRGDLIGWLIGRYVQRWIDRNLDHAVNMAIIAWIANNYQPKDTFDDHT